MIKLGPKETEVIARLSYEKVRVVTKKRLEALFGQTVLVRQVIYQLKKKGILKPITKGVSVSYTHLTLPTKRIV